MARSRFGPIALAAAIAVLVSLPTMASALSNVTGQADFTYGVGATVKSGPSAQNGTGLEAESKLFYTQDGSWWAVLGADSPAPGAVSIYHLVNHQWQQALVLPGSDPWMKADTLYDATNSKLYIALRDNKTGVTGNPRASQLYVLSYAAVGGTWTLQTGPTQITTKNPRNLTIALDSQNRVWATYEISNKISVGYTQPGATKFTFSNMAWPSVTSSDTSAVTSFGTSLTGFKIGVMWSDTVTKQYVFAWRSDSDPLGGTWHIETAYGNGVGGCPTATTSACANYHISLRANGDDVYAALKLLSQDSTNPQDPLIVLAHRDVLGQWSASTVSYVSQNTSRQILILAPLQDRLYVIAEGPKTSGTDGLFVWESSLSSPSFDPTLYSFWSIPNQNAHEDPTSTKQPLGIDGLGVVESSQGKTNQYWHNEFSAF